jgi:hypothetical protein
MSSTAQTIPATLHIPKTLKFDGQVAALKLGVTFSELVSHALVDYLANLSPELSSQQAS